MIFFFYPTKKHSLLNAIVVVQIIMEKIQTRQCSSDFQPVSAHTERNKMHLYIKNEQTELNKTLKSGIPVAVYQAGWALLWKFLTAAVEPVLRFSYGEN